jgi:SPP1 family predicted phage head-tail adaptor
MPNTMLQAGKLRHRIQIVEPTLARDSSGGWDVNAATPVVNAWASVEALAGRELYAAQQKVSQVTHKVTIRYRDGIKSKQNVWFHDRMFEIQAVENPDERTKMLVLLCLERADSSQQEGGDA